MLSSFSSALVTVIHAAFGSRQGTTIRLCCRGDDSRRAGIVSDGPERAPKLKP